ncbi:MAG: SH3 domain-containing protein [Nitrospinota bacterium]|nr:SH3 domain-containing protein [Nitrospinota bacterium]
MWIKNNKVRWFQIWISALAGILLLGAGPQEGYAQYRQLDIVPDVKSRFSAGCSSIQQLMTQAEFKGLDGLVFGDYDRNTLQYGIPLFERILKVKIGRPALLDNGAATYLSEINQIDQSDDTLVLVPGVESAPFYYWSGNPLDENLVAHNWDKHLLIIGLPNSRDYEEIPILNSGFTTRYWEENILLFLVLCTAALIGLYGLMGKRYRGVSFLFMVIMGLLAANFHPFKSSPFDQYQGDLGVEPYQYLIDYADSRGALVFWSHLETPVIKDLAGGPLQVKIQTGKHSEDLLLTRHYTGFQALSENRVSAAEPGNEWDRVLTSYLQGVWDRPVWGYGANDFHCEGPGKLGAVRTVVLVKQKNRASVVEALGTGRMYAVKQKDGNNRLSLDRFELVDPVSGNRAVMGEGLKTGETPNIELKLSMTGASESHLAKIRLIRNGRVVKQALVRLPYEDVWQAPEADNSLPSYYRLMVEFDEHNQLVSNPLFVNAGTMRKPVVAAANAEDNPVVSPPPPSPLRINTDPLPPKKPEEAEPLVALKPEVEPSQPEPQAEPPAPETQVTPLPSPAADSEPPAAPSSGGTYVEVLGDGLRLRKGPSTQFPVVGKADKGERLRLVRRTEVLYNGKPWIVIEKEGDPAYVWSGLVKELPAD